MSPLSPTSPPPVRRAPWTHQQRTTVVTLAVLALIGTPVTMVSGYGVLFLYGWAALFTTLVLPLFGRPGRPKALRFIGIPIFAALYLWTGLTMGIGPAVKVRYASDTAHSLAIVNAHPHLLRADAAAWAADAGAGAIAADPSTHTPYPFHDPLLFPLAKAIFTALAPSTPHTDQYHPKTHPEFGATTIFVDSPTAADRMLDRIDTIAAREGWGPRKDWPTANRATIIKAHLPYIGIPSVACIFDAQGALVAVRNTAVLPDLNLVAIPEAAPIVAACANVPRS